MNKLYKWCLLSCMAATLSSCNDFLTEENPSGLTADTFTHVTHRCVFGMDRNMPHQ